MIKITLNNGNSRVWPKNTFTDYKYDSKCFIVIKDEEYVGIYNMDYVVSVVISKDKD